MDFKILKIIGLALFSYFLGIFFIIVFPIMLLIGVCFRFKLYIIEENNIKGFLKDVIFSPISYYEEVLAPFFKLEIIYIYEMNQIEQYNNYGNRTNTKNINWKQIGF